MKRALFASLAAVAAATALAAPAAHAATTPVPVYDATEHTNAGNVVSVGFEATSASEVGDEVALAGTQRKLNAISVTMSTWACQYGSWNAGNCASPNHTLTSPLSITLNIYAAGTPQSDGTVLPGALIAKATKSFAIPYRPSANYDKCNTHNNASGKWWNAADGKCYNGKKFTITFQFGSLGLTLPDDVVLGVAYNTSNFGYHPFGQSTACYTADGGCFYDALNVGLGSDGITTGSKPNPGTVYQNTSWAGGLCDTTPALGVFNLDSPTSACWAGTDVAFKVTAH